MVRKKLCARCTSKMTGGFYCRECQIERNRKAREDRRTRKELGILPVMITVRCSPDDAEMIRKQAKERGQSVNRYLVDIGRAGEV